MSNNAPADRDSASDALMLGKSMRHGYILFDVAQGKPRLIDLAGDHGSDVIAVPDRFLDRVSSLGGFDPTALIAGLTSDRMSGSDSDHESRSPDPVQESTS